jgi:hypothetical protein
MNKLQKVLIKKKKNKFKNKFYKKVDLIGGVG